MPAPDDIRPDAPPTSQSERSPTGNDAARKPMKEVGPESEVRGGPEAPEEEDLTSPVKR
jgi:hypothetical protein